MKKTDIQKPKGQLTLFGILFIIVALFVYGMVNGIGLMVHHKINVQNSVDIGAIYAAQKQAQTLSVLSHLNYQLRQNYKLFSYRYNVLGNIGSYRKAAGAEEHIDILRTPYPPAGEIICPNSNSIGGCATPPNSRSCSVNNISDPARCPFAVCIWHPFFSIPSKRDNDNACQIVDTVLNLPNPTQAGPISTLGSLYAERITQRGVADIHAACSDLGYVNWLVASAVFLSFYEEQKERKKFIEEYFEKIIKQNKDLTGNSINEGAKKTIVKNFTLPVWTSYSSPGSAFLETRSSAEGKNFTDFFEWIEISTDDLHLNYVQDLTPSIATEACQREIWDIFKPCFESCGVGCGKIQSMPDASGTRCDLLSNIVGNPNSRKMVIGFRVKPDMKPFYNQIFLSIAYKSGIFFPFRDSIPMVAEAYSKPFGASLGPHEEDPLIPSTKYPIHSTFFGGRAGVDWGLLAGQRQIRLNQLIHKFIAQAGGPEGAGFSLINYQQLHGVGSAMVIPFEGTPLSAANLDKIFTLPARILEEIAISPDKYDLNHYTILPNYMLSAYIQLVESGLFNDVSPSPDIGHLSKTNHEFLSKINQNETASSGIFPNSSLPLISPPKSYKDHAKVQQEGFLKTEGIGKIPFHLNYIEKQIHWVNLYYNYSYFGSSYNLSPLNKIPHINSLLTSWVPSMNPRGVQFVEQLYPSAPNVNVTRMSPLGACQNNKVPFQCCHLRDTALSQQKSMAKLEMKPIPSLSSSFYLSWDRSNIKNHILDLSHCIVGGRTGFSAKIIDKNYPNTEDLLLSEKAALGF